MPARPDAGDAAQARPGGRCGTSGPGPGADQAATSPAHFVRSCHEGERHLEVRVGDAQTPEGGRRVFGAVAEAGTDIAALIRRALDAVGRTGDTALNAFTDGCPGLRSVLAEAGVTSPPILDWFHLSMRLQYAEQASEVLSTEALVMLRSEVSI